MTLGTMTTENLTEYVHIVAELVRQGITFEARTISSMTGRKFEITLTGGY